MYVKTIFSSEAFATAHWTFLQVFITTAAIIVTLSKCRVGQPTRVLLRFYLSANSITEIVRKATGIQTEVRG